MWGEFGEVRWGEGGGCGGHLGQVVNDDTVVSEFVCVLVVVGCVCFVGPVLCRVGGFGASAGGCCRRPGWERELRLNWNFWMAGLETARRVQSAASGSGRP